MEQDESPVTAPYRPDEELGSEKQSGFCNALKSLSTEVYSLDPVESGLVFRTPLAASNSSKPAPLPEILIGSAFHALRVTAPQLWRAVPQSPR